MIEKIFTEDEIKLLEDLKLEGINNLNIEDIIRIEDVISKFLKVNGFDKNYNITKDGKLAESILDKISEL
ncbi:hypothetical protein [Finegoldia magna]|uniref:hypothetical protein n=1 Tax=Finegoldia magna TaxID=1260 RepID=UPI0018F8A2EA|nr:hypothetical protein [Finegoldia magna]MDU2131919.1 hypothetical protein [Finegoldia magna]MDU6553061.1 hypothetical protein [Finegoldia magna]